MKIPFSILLSILLSLINPEIDGQQESRLSGETRKISTEENNDNSVESVFLHTDRDEYIAGEYMWYAAYLVSPGRSEPASGNNIIYLELLNCDKIPVVQKQVSIISGTGNGGFMLPDTISSGSYILRAYTNVLKNYSPEKSFMKVINIYNTFSNKGFCSVSINGKIVEPGLILNPGIFKFKDKNVVPGKKDEKSEEEGSNGNYIRIESNESFNRRQKIVVSLIAGKRMATLTGPLKLSISVSALTDSESQVDSTENTSLLSTGFTGSGPEKPESRKLIFKSEEESRFLSGRIVPQNAMGNVSGKTILLSVPGKEAFFQYAVTDSEGNFSFSIEKGFIQKDLVIQVAGNPDNDLIRINSSFWDNFPDFSRTDNTNNSVSPSYVEDWSINYQLARIYEIKPAAESTETGKTCLLPYRFYGNPDFELKMADYLLLPAMQEVFFELVPGVSMRSSRANYRIDVVNPRDNKPYDADATLMVDGIIIRDPAVIAGMNPEEVERIDVVNDEYVTGGYHFHGIVNIITKDGNFKSLPLPGNAVRLSRKAEEPELSFVSPDYSEQVSEPGRTPDFRNTLYWNPSVGIDRNGQATVELWASDYITDYVINILGVTHDGKPVTAKKIIRVE